MEPFGCLRAHLQLRCDCEPSLEGRVLQEGALARVHGSQCCWYEVKTPAITVKPLPTSSQYLDQSQSFPHLSSIQIYRRTSELLLLQLVAGPTGTVPFLDTAPTFSAATAQVSFAVPAVATTVQLLSCCLGISSIPRSVADLQCCHSFSIYCSACCRYQRQCSCCTSAASATTFIDLVSVSIKVKHPGMRSTLLLSPSSQYQRRASIQTSSSPSFTIQVSRSIVLLLLQLVAVLSMLKLLLFLQLERFHLQIHRRPSALLQLKYLLQCLRSLPRFNSCPVVSVSVQFLGLLQTFSAATASASITVHVVATNVNALAVQVLQPSLIQYRSLSKSSIQLPLQQKFWVATVLDHRHKDAQTVVTATQAHSSTILK